MRPYRNDIKIHAHRGQILVVALAVLFVLLFIGGLFVAQIARNLNQEGHSRDLQVARDLADAGLRYADDALTNSPEGADWRPGATTPIPAANPTQDPDYYWLNLGFTRFNRNGGRFLVRVVYDPHNTDPRSQYLRVESVGRVGDITDPVDPTVAVQSGPAPRLHAERVGYKQIGLTDYLRYVTNKYRSSVENFLGTPTIGRSLATVFGDPTLATSGSNNGVRNNNLLFGGAIRVSGNVRFGENTFFYLSQRGNDPALNNSPEGVFVSGNIVTPPAKDGSGQPLTTNVVAVNQQIDAAINPNNVLQASTDSTFSSMRGQVRDGSTNPDREGYTRGIPYLPPPVMDSYASGTSTFRYRKLTRDSGVEGNLNGTRYNTGLNGWGRGIYVDNGGDLQKETNIPGVNGSFSLVREWTNPDNLFGQGSWQGPFYRPPGVQVEFLGNVVRLTRNDGRRFAYPDGTPVTAQGGSVLEIPLTDYDRANYHIPDGTITGRAFPLPPLAHDGDNAENATGNPANYASPFTDKNSYGVNLVLMAEGNVRVKGSFGTLTNPSELTERDDTTNGPIRKLARVHVTVVTAGTAYVEGNLIKGDADRASTCAILARDYVCVNTTMFMTPQNQSGSWTQVSGQNAFQTEIGLTRPYYDASFNFGANPSSYTVNNGAANSPVYLMLRHAAAAGPLSLLSMLINPGTANTVYPFNVNGSASNLYPLGSKSLGASIFENDGISTAPNFESKAFDLTPVAGSLTTNPGYDNVLRLTTGTSVGNSIFNGQSTQNYLLSGIMVAPLDIRIEALLYAQERSFFIIPGYGMNPNPADTRAAYQAAVAAEIAANNTFNPADPYNASYARFAVMTLRPSYNKFDTAEDRRMKDAYPFYGEPMAVRITIFGAISENVTASMSDQAKWMDKWGWFPATHGSLIPTTDAPNAGFVPDDFRKGQDPDGLSNPGTDRTLDFRVPNLERSSPTDETKNITRGLRFLYDPTLALPYNSPTTYVANEKQDQRQARAVRFVWRNSVNPGGSPLRQTLPPLPRLPVCSGLLFVGDPERPFGS